MAADPEKRTSSKKGRRDEASQGGKGRSSSHGAEAYAETAAGIGDQSGPPGVLPVDQAEEDDEDGPDPLIGKVLSGLYKVEDRIGEGGMGTVYLALHVHLNKSFAVKVLSPKIASDKEAVERLRQEAVAASSIDHDNIVSVVNFDATDEGEVFIVMELLKGQPLSSVIEEGPLPLDKAIPITMQICRALGAAHERGIVHRDLKPENVFVVRKHEQDVAKVLDFGISKIKSADAESVRMTKTGQLVGTPLYMSPEQAKGEQDIDKRADVYALGVMLYEMLTGVPPFEGGNYFQLLWKHGNEDPEPPTKVAPHASIPQGVEDAILKAMQKERDERFQTMDEFEDALAAATPDIGLPAQYMSLPPKPRASGGAEAGASAASAGAAAPTPAPGEVGIQQGPSKRALGIGLGALVVIGLAVAGALALGGEQTAEPPDEVASAPSKIGTTEGSADEGSADQASADKASADQASADQASADEGSADQADDLPEGRSAPPTVSVTFETRPDGAEVRVDGEVLGETPLVAPLPAGDEAVEVTLSRRGYRDAVVSVVPEEGAEVRERLRPRRRPSGGGGSSDDDPPLPIKKEL